MYCQKCGQEISDNQYCTQCGAMAPKPLEQKAESLKTKKTQKRKVILIVGIAFIVLAGAAATLFFCLTTPVKGRWYNEDRGEVLVFDRGNISVESLVGTQKGTYNYSRLKGIGRYTVNGMSYDFTAGTQVSVNGLGAYAKADDHFDTNSFIDQYGNLGTWYNEERGEVLIFGTQGRVQSVYLNAVNEMSYEYNYEDQAGTIMGGKFLCVQFGGEIAEYCRYGCVYVSGKRI